MEYQIIEECYIPEESEDTKSGGCDIATELETLAIRNANLPEKYQSVAETKALGLGKKPEGTIQVYNDYTGAAEGIRGVKVRCHYLVNISSAYTDESGRYHIGKRYLFDPHYAIVYDNIKDFVIWGNWAFVSAANDNIGYRSNKGHDKRVFANENGWKWAVINNAAYDFYKMCLEEGLKTPPPNLKIWCWPNASYSSTPMLHHLTGANSGIFASSLASVLAPGKVTAIINTAVSVICSGLPDITIGMSESGATPDSNYKKHYYVVWHELFHASHFSQVGEELWGPYINYILTHGFGYGDGTAKETAGKNICELGESWAYANEYCSAGYVWDRKIWFKKSVVSIKQFLDNGILTRKQMYDCLTKDVKSIDDFKKKLVEKYPSKTYSIYATF